MKNLITLLLLSIISFSLQAQSPIGAWEATMTNDKGESLKSVVIFSEGFQVLTVYNETTNEFIQTNGGSWSLSGNTMTETVEFSSDFPDAVGQTVSFEIEITDKTLGIVGQEMTLTRIDDGNPGQLNGAWLMSGRKRDGEIQERDTTRPRKTMKILSGTRFQWIAYDTEKKSFSGSGGGTYTTIDGEYTENIEFFSRDATRVGASLNFDFELLDGAWHHSGLSSKGSPIYEIWSKR